MGSFLYNKTSRFVIEKRTYSDNILNTDMSLIYMDNAATSWPKPPEVLSAIAETIQNAGGNPGRGGHRMAVTAGKVLYSARETVPVFWLR